MKSKLHGVGNDRLVCLLKSGDAEAFKVLYNELYPKICSYAESYLHHTHMAEEISQDVFLYLWEKRECIADDTRFLPYLMRITRNKCLNQMKASRLRPISVGEWDSVAVDLNSSALEDKSSNQILANELNGLINGTVESLSANCREAFLLSREKGMKYREISEHTGVPVKTVEARMSRSLSLFREKLSDYL